MPPWNVATLGYDTTVEPWKSLPATLAEKVKVGEEIRNAVWNILKAFADDGGFRNLETRDPHGARSSPHTYIYKAGGSQPMPGDESFMPLKEQGGGWFSPINLFDEHGPVRGYGLRITTMSQHGGYNARRQAIVIHGRKFLRVKLKDGVQAKDGGNDKRDYENIDTFGLVHVSGFPAVGSSSSSVAVAVPPPVMPMQIVPAQAIALPPPPPPVQVVATTLAVNDDQWRAAFKHLCRTMLSSPGVTPAQAMRNAVDSHDDEATKALLTQMLAQTESEIQQANNEASTWLAPP